MKAAAFDDATMRELERLREAKDRADMVPVREAARREMAGVRIEPERRFTDKPAMNPAAVRSLPDDHPAMTEGRTLFPSTVVEVTDEAPDRLLVSGRNNRKLGDTVAKGRFKGYALYGLSLEERATCPDDCTVRGYCYGNGMQMARRHRIGDPEIFYERLGDEVRELLQQHPLGILVRLHVLGDFPSVDYVANWADLLEDHEKLAIYGYTARRSIALEGDEIGDAIDAVRERFPERFRIRQSWGELFEAEIEEMAGGDNTYVIDALPDDTPSNTIVCPTQTDATACCATCGLCWEPANADNSILFLRHGPKSDEAQLDAEMKRAPSPEPTEDGALARRIQAAATIRTTPDQRASVGIPPEARMADPCSLLVEGAYQRDLSFRSIKLLRKIVGGWDWAKFKPPICAERDQGLVVIDGQHTAIAAATLRIPHIPVLVVTADEIARRADSFVSHNRDRIIMSPFQIFHASVVAGDAAAMAIATIAEHTGAIIPRAASARGRGRPGEIIAISDIERAYKVDGADTVARIFRIAVAAQAAPLTRLTTRALRILLTQSYFADYAKMPDSRIANALKAMVHVFEDRARHRASEEDQPLDRVGALMIAEACDEAARAAS